MTAGLLVKHATPLCQLQDLGRIGYRAQGVTRSGAMDRFNLKVANALVANPLNTACLELTLTGATFELTATSARIALAGDFDFKINGIAKEVFCSHRIVEGDTIEIGAPQTGLRAYLAIAGGFDSSPILGSCATHTRSKLGGFAHGINFGETLPIKAPIAVSGHECSLRQGLRRGPKEIVRVVAGPQQEHFSSSGIESFYTSAYKVTDECDRMGIRLDGARIEHVGDGNIISDPVMPGSVQVPAGGQPIILMADGPTTGGYPKIATVASVDLAVLAQLAPGAGLQFEQISVEESQTLVRDEARFFASLPQRLDRF
ncbi:MAG: biotin-dependent carboxyltransferase family protein [Pseudomonadales bacterium]